MVDLADLAPPTIDASSIQALTKSSSCGINLGLDVLKGLQRQLDVAMASLLSGSDGIFSSIGSLGSILTLNLSGLFDGLKLNLPKLPKTPSLELQSLFNSLLAQLAVGGDISALVASIRANFPTFDIQAAFNKISLGQFDLCSSIPNLKIIDGIVAELPPACPKPTIDAIEIPESVVIPAAKDLMGVVNSAMPVAVESLKNFIANAQIGLPNSATLSTMSVSMVKTNEQATASIEPIVEALKTRSGDFESSIKSLEAQSAASAKIALGGINSWNAQAAELGSSFNAQMSKVFTSEKIEQIETQMNASTANLKTNTAPLKNLIETNLDRLTNFSGTSENIQKASDTSLTAI